jgi:hypothetical protein
VNLDSDILSLHRNLLLGLPKAMLDQRHGRTHGQGALIGR